MDWTQIVIAVLAFVAAGFWFWSAVVRIPNLLETPLEGPGSLTEIMKEQSRLSAIAAVFAGLSAIVAAVAQIKLL